ncbi:hypothetical protein [Microtetraspora glauca]|uniref:Uncharacterized protein n=1 Tax=Microtetraspora glauca TaxID=1996 RepID=A0ABV3GKA0_MICGL
MGVASGVLGHAERQREALTAAYDAWVLAITTTADDARARATRAESEVDAERAERLQAELDRMRAAEEIPARGRRKE